MDNPSCWSRSTLDLSSRCWCIYWRHSLWYQLLELAYYWEGWGESIIAQICIILTYEILTGLKKLSIIHKNNLWICTCVITSVGDYSLQTWELTHLRCRTDLKYNQWDIGIELQQLGYALAPTHNIHPLTWKNISLNLQIVTCSFKLRLVEKYAL